MRLQSPHLPRPLLFLKVCALLFCVLISPLSARSIPLVVLPTLASTPSGTVKDPLLSLLLSNKLKRKKVFSLQGSHLPLSSLIPLMKLPPTEDSIPSSLHGAIILSSEYIVHKKRISLKIKVIDNRSSTPLLLLEEVISLPIRHSENFSTTPATNPSRTLSRSYTTSKEGILHRKLIKKAIGDLESYIHPIIAK